MYDFININFIIGKINENFIKVNLKKKTYARGKKHLKGSMIKRAEWKRKVAAKEGKKVEKNSVTTLILKKKSINYIHILLISIPKQHKNQPASYVLINIVGYVGLIIN